MPDSAVPAADSELRAHVERVLSAHYELESELGRGGMGIVYRARDRRLKRHVAIKVLPPELAFRSEIKTRFLREAEMAAQLNHPNIVPIYLVDEAEGLVFFVMAYVSGDNLAKRLHDNGVLGTDETRRILRDVADALAYAHERGVIHRDIKPDNILIDADSGRPMVTDFGIARAVSEGDSRLTATGMAIGTPAYMSPEQAAGEREIDGRSDLYSLGIVGYQMLIGEPPFIASSTPAILVKHISERPTPLEQRRADVPPDLARAIMMCLEKDPAMRFGSASALVAALDSGRIPEQAGAGAARATAERSPMPTAATFAGGAPSISPLPAVPLPVPELYQPTAEELRRWDAPPVQAFRRKLAPYLFVNGVIVLASIFSGSDFFVVTVFWSIYMAFKYAKLWADGYDWRDVFRQPRERELIDVADEAIEWVRAVFNRDKRAQLKEQRRAKRLSGATARASFNVGAGAQPLPPAAALQAAGVYGSRVRQATIDRDEIVNLVGTMSAADRSRIPDVVRSAVALHDRIQALAISLDEVERSVGPGALDTLEAEIARLESAANPLDEKGSDERVRRLAYLKRQRRATADLAERRNALSAKLETCAIALQNMKLDVLRLRAGAQTHQHITSLANDALHLADSVDSAMYVADELGGRSAGGPGRPRRGSAQPSAGRG